MTSTEIRAARQQLRDAAGPQDQQGLRTEFTHRAEQSIEEVGRRRTAARERWRDWTSRWHNIDVPETMVPGSEPDERDEWLISLLGGWAAFLAEAGSAAVIFWMRGSSGWWGVLTAVLLSAVTHGILYIRYLAKASRPREAYRIMKAGIFRAALYGFSLAALLAIGARYADGESVLALLPLLRIAMVVLTLSLLVISACCFGAASLFRKGARLAEEVWTLDREVTATRSFLTELRQPPGPDHDPNGPSRRPSTPPSSPGSDVHVPALRMEPAMTTRSMSSSSSASQSAVILLIISAAAFSACTAPEQPASAVLAAGPAHPAKDPSAPLHDDCEVDVEVDVSGSVLMLQETLDHLRDELAAIVERHRCREIMITKFAEDGWIPSVVKRIGVPATSIAPRREGANEFSRVFKDVREAEEQRTEQSEQRARSAYLTHVSAALKDIGSAELMEAASRGSSSTDIVGVLRRIGSTGSNVRRIVLIVTDLVDTNIGKIRDVPPPPGRVDVLVVVAPSTPDEMLRMYRHQILASEQYAERMAALRQTAGWVIVVPFFTQDLAALIGRGQRGTN